MNWDRSLYLKLADELFRHLFPICRSLTGEGNRRTLARLQQLIPLNLFEIPSGKKVFDWVVPDEWSIRDAWVKDSQGKKVIDFQKCNVSLVNCSEPVKLKMSFEDLKSKIHTLPKLPKAIPYRTSYFKKDWGFCMAHEDFEKLDRADTYEVFIDSSFDSQGSLTYADIIHAGTSKKEILLSTYCCHPSLANDNLSGLILSTLLFKYIATQKTHYTYRLVMAPETLGVICYLFENQSAFTNILGGAVITTVGGRGPFGLKKSFQENSIFDQVAEKVLEASGESWVQYPFIPDGSDERQYASPGFRIPTVSITKDKYYEYPEYHTSLDNLEFVRPENLVKTLEIYMKWFHELETTVIYSRTEPHCEYQLGKRGLYPNLGGAINQMNVTKKDVEAMSWLMFGCDGKTSLVEISKRSKLPIEDLQSAAIKMEEKNLLRREF